MRKLLILCIILVIGISGCTKKLDGRNLKEVQYALREIRIAYEKRPEQYDDNTYTIDDAIDDIDIEERILVDWNFEIVGKPPTKYVANSSSVNEIGEGKKIWYDVTEKAYHGFGIDK